MADDLEQTIHDNAAGPAVVSSDAGSVTQQRLLDQIEADKYLAAKGATAASGRGLVFNKLVPPGAV